MSHWRSLALGATLIATATGAFAQAKEQFFPLLAYRTGAYRSEERRVGKECRL